MPREFSRTYQPKNKPVPGAPRSRAKVANEFRDVIRRLLENNIPNVERWLHEVAEGCARKGLAADPKAALDIIGKLAEYAAPKYSRIDVNPHDPTKGPPVTQIALTFVDGRAPSAPALTPALEAPSRVKLEALPTAGPTQPGARKRVRRSDAKSE